MSTSARANEGEPRDVAHATRAWALLFIDGLMIASASLYWLARGHFLERVVEVKVAGGSWAVVQTLLPRAEELVAAVVRMAGALGLCAGILIMATAATSFRRGERWSWFALWIVPFLPTMDLAVFGAYGALTPLSILWDAMALVLALAGLIAPARAFFPPEAPPDAGAREDYDEASEPSSSVPTASVAPQRAQFLISSSPPS